VRHERGGAAGPERHGRDPELPRHAQREAHQHRGQHAGDRRHAGRGVEQRDEVPERRRAARARGHGEAAAVVLLAAVGLGEPVRDGLEAEPLAAPHGAGALRGLHAPVVVLGVDEGDVDAVAVQQLGDLQRRVDVAGARVRHNHDVRPRHGRKGSCTLDDKVGLDRDRIGSDLPHSPGYKNRKTRIMKPRRKWPFRCRRQTADKSAYAIERCSRANFSLVAGRPLGFESLGKIATSKTLEQG